MSKELVGSISGALVVLSAIPYIIRIYQKKITPNLTSWGLWTLIGLSLLLTYKSSGAEANVWPAVFGFINPMLVVVLILWKGGTREKIQSVEIACLVFSLVALAMWWFMRSDKTLAQYALYVSIVADAFAAIPTIVLYWSDPSVDRPFAWTFFGIGYGLAFFSIPEWTFANMILPIYMFVGAGLIALPLILHRVKQGIPLKEWI